MKKFIRSMLVFHLSSLLIPLAIADDEDRLIRKAMKQVESAYEKTDPKEIETFKKKTFEAYNFVNYLGCLGVMPFLARDEVESFSMMKWPLSSMESQDPSYFKIEYPLVLAVHIKPKDKTRGILFVVATQSNNDSSWEMTEGNIKSAGEMKIKIPVPSAEIQRRANAELPRLMKDWEFPNNKGLQQAGCVGSRVLPLKHLEHKRNGLD